MCVVGLEYCNCDCHEHPGEMFHCMACCYTCEWCGRRITTYYYEEHKTECQKTGRKRGLRPSAYASAQKHAFR